MWKDDEGVGHTVALPDPSTAMSSTSLHGLEQLSVEERTKAIDALDEFYWNEYAAAHPNFFETSDLGPVGVALPEQYVQASIKSAEDVMHAVRITEPAWRIDVLEAFQDYFAQTQAAIDLEALPCDIRDAARVEPNGEVLWPLVTAVEAVKALASTGHVVLGLDMRDYGEDGSFVEVAWSDYDGDDPTTACHHALDALSRDELPGQWALVTWR